MHLPEKKFSHLSHSKRQILKTSTCLRILMRQRLSRLLHLIPLLLIMRRRLSSSSSSSSSSKSIAVMHKVAIAAVVVEGKVVSAPMGLLGMSNRTRTPIH